MLSVCPTAMMTSRLIPRSLETRSSSFALASGLQNRLVEVEERISSERDLFRRGRYHGRRLRRWRNCWRNHGSGCLLEQVRVAFDLREVRREIASPPSTGRTGPEQPYRSGSPSTRQVFDGMSVCAIAAVCAEASNAARVNILTDLFMFLLLISR